MGKYQEYVLGAVCFLAAAVSLAAAAAICFFLFAGAVPFLQEEGILSFLGGRDWQPTEGVFGIFPMLVGSAYVTGGAVLLGVPPGLLCAVFLARFCPAHVYRIARPLVETMAGIPSVVYGLFGISFLVPLVKRFCGGSGRGILSAAVMLAIMILPTVISVAESAIRAVPESYYAGARALGASREQSVFFALLPGAAPGMLAAVMLGIGRAVGETMAVVMVAGNQTWMPQSVTAGVRTLTGLIALEMGYAAEGKHRDALISAGAVLFVWILLMNLAAMLLQGLYSREKPRGGSRNKEKACRRQRL